MKTIIIAGIIISVAIASLLIVVYAGTKSFIWCEQGYSQVGNECVKIQCGENFVIYENNCVPVNSETRFTFDATLYFKSVDGIITELCERDFQVIPEVETCKEIPVYHITEFNEIIIQWDYEDWITGEENVELSEERK